MKQGPGPGGQLITVARFRDLPLAELARSRLEEEGIPCFLAGQYHIGLNWLYSNALGGVRVQVPAPEAARARAIIAEDRAGELAPLFPDQPDAGPAPERCPVCGADDIVLRREPRRFISLLVSILVYPFLAFRRRYRCNRCGSTFRKPV